MASDNEATCESDPNFAVICAFMEKFGVTCGLASIDFLELQEMLENTQEVPQELIDLHIKLLRKSRKTVSNERWEKAVIKFCHTFCSQDAWEIERFGYKKARLSSKLRVLKELLEMQFDFNARFKAEINKMSAEELRSQPLGKDKQGHAYWFQSDNNCQIRVYKEDPDEETWTLVAKDRDGLVALINELNNGDNESTAINEEDSNSLAEKPIIDTGQVDSSSSESVKKLSGADSENTNESIESKKEENISPLTEEDEEVKIEVSKRARESEDESEDAAKKPKLEEVVGEAIEEPLMLVKGKGSGQENECVNPIVGEEIEEEVMFFSGEGNGFECQTGNEDKPSDTEAGTSGRDASDSKFVSINSDSKNCVSSSSEVPTSPVKSAYKLGTIIDTKTDNKYFNTVRSPTKKSRWDVETIMAKEPSKTNCAEEATKKPMFFFGPGCLQFKPTVTVGFGQKVPQEKKEDLGVLPTNAKGDIGYRIEENEETKKADVASDCVQPLGNEETAATLEPVPVIEEQCVKKFAYVCGEESEETKDIVENHQNEDNLREEVGESPVLTYTEKEKSEAQVSSQSEERRMTEDSLHSTDKNGEKSVEVSVSKKEDEAQVTLQSEEDTPRCEEMTDRDEEKSVSSKSVVEVSDSKKEDEAQVTLQSEEDASRCEEMTYREEEKSVSSESVAEVSDFKKEDEAQLTIESEKSSVIEVSDSKKEDEVQMTLESEESRVIEDTSHCEDTEKFTTDKDEEKSVSSKSEIEVSDFRKEDVAQVSLQTEESKMNQDTEKLTTDRHEEKLVSSESDFRKEDVAQVSLQTEEIKMTQDTEKLTADRSEEILVSSKSEEVFDSKADEAQMSLQNEESRVIEDSLHCEDTEKLTIGRDEEKSVISKSEEVSVSKNDENVQVKVDDNIRTRDDTKADEIRNEENEEVGTKLVDIHEEVENTKVIDTKCEEIRQENVNQTMNEEIVSKFEDSTKVDEQPEMGKDTKFDEAKSKVEVVEAKSELKTNEDDTKDDASVKLIKPVKLDRKESEETEVETPKTQEIPVLEIIKPVEGEAKIEMNLSCINKETAIKGTAKKTPDFEESTVQTKHEEVAVVAAPAKESIVEVKSYKTPVFETGQVVAVVREVKNEENIQTKIEDFVKVVESKENENKVVFDGEIKDFSKNEENIQTKIKDPVKIAESTEGPDKESENKVVFDVKIKDFSKDFPREEESTKSEESSIPGGERKAAMTNKRSRKNNSVGVLPDEEKMPRTSARRATRSSKNGENQPESVEIVQPATPPTRRGRPRKSEKEENGKKMKMSEETPGNIQKSAERESEDVEELSAASTTSTESSEKQSEESEIVQKRRGRPRKSEKESDKEMKLTEEAKSNKKEEREDVKELSAVSATLPESTEKQSEEGEIVQTRRGRPRKSEKEENGKKMKMSEEIPGNNQKEVEKESEDVEEISAASSRATSTESIEKQSEESEVVQTRRGRPRKSEKEEKGKKMKMPEEIPGNNQRAVEKGSEDVEEISADSSRATSTESSEKQSEEGETVQTRRGRPRKSEKESDKKLKITGEVKADEKEASKDIKGVFAVSSPISLPESSEKPSEPDEILQSTVPAARRGRPRKFEKEVSDKKVKMFDNNKKALAKEESGDLTKLPDASSSVILSESSDNISQSNEIFQSARRGRSRKLEKEESDNKIQKDDIDNNKKPGREESAVSSPATPTDAVVVETEPIEVVQSVPPTRRGRPRKSEKEESGKKMKMSETQADRKKSVEVKAQETEVVEDVGKKENEEDSAAVSSATSETNENLPEPVEIVQEAVPQMRRGRSRRLEKEESDKKTTSEEIQAVGGNQKEAEQETEVVTSVDKKEESEEVKKLSAAPSPATSTESSEKQSEPDENAQTARRGRSRKLEKEDSEKKSQETKAEEIKESENVEGLLVPSSSDAPAETVVIESSNSSDVVELPDEDPLAPHEEEDNEKEESKKPMSLANFSLDFNESPNVTPPRSGMRKRGRESPQNLEESEATSGKRMKMKAKRAVDIKLRKSIEEQKKQELASSDDDSKNEAEEDKKPMKIEEGGDGEPKKKHKTTKNKNKRILSNLGIDPEQALNIQGNQIVGVRQSRRIAQLKIKEEAERRKLEEEVAHETHKKKKSKKHEDKDYRGDRKKSKNEADDEEPAEDSADSKKRKKKKKKHRMRFDEFNPWRSSSDSSSSEEEEEEEMAYEDEDEELQYVSDHEFSPESDLEGDGEAQPLKRARTVRKEEDDVEEVDDCPCQKCGKSDHPEWILLCDKCDNGWHCSCLRPPLLVIPEGDWFCPPCQHSSLLKNLQEKLCEYDKKLSKKEIEDRRKQRLAYVGISLNSVLPENIKKRRVSTKEDDEDDDEEDERDNDDDAEVDDEEDASSEESESGSGSASASQTGSDSDEPIYQLRQRRQAHSYRFNDYDELINSAIQEEMEAVKGAGNQGRGKDIATIVNAEKEEIKKEEQPEQIELEPLPPVVPLNDKDKEPKPIFSDDEPVKKKKIIGRKKHRKLNSLDISSADDDEDSDEDFKGTSTESDDDFDEDLGSEDSDLDTGRNRRKGPEAVRRSTRARTSRYDADFIDDGDSDDEDEAPRRKKKRSFWDESESEESDRSWGRRKRKPASRQKKPTNPSKKKSKKKKKNDDSDAEVYRKKKPKIKFGLDGDDDGPVRRTRGKKINYIDALGSDSDEDRVKRPPPRIESEEEYVVDEDEKASEESGDEKNKVQIQSYTDARFTQLLPEPKNILHEDGDSELNPIDQINRNVEMMDENQMEKMMEEEEYANKQLQLVAQQLEKEKRRKEREAKKLETEPKKPPPAPARRKEEFQFMQEPLVGNVLINSDNNDELSEPPGVSLPLFAELGAEEEKKRRALKNKKSLEEAVANLGNVRQPEESNIEIAAPPQPFSQSQPTPSVITRMLQSKPGQPGYPIGTIRPKQFAAMPEREEDMHHYPQGGVRPQPYRQLYPRNPVPIRNPIPQMYSPSPSGGGPINMDHSPSRVVSPAASSPGSNKNETPPPPYTRAPPPGRFPMGAGPRHIHPLPPHMQPQRPNLSPYHPGMPPVYHYGQFGQEEAMPVYPPYPETFEGGTGENSNSKSFDEESGGEFGGLVSYFSSQREDDLES